METYEKFDYDAFHSHDRRRRRLDNLLGGVSRVGIVGYIAQICVRKTAHTAARRYDTVVCPDLIGVCQNDEQGHRRVIFNDWDRRITIKDPLEDFLEYLTAPDKADE